MSRPPTRNSFVAAGEFIVGCGAVFPTLILTAEDDPFVPPEQFRDPVLRDNPHIAVCIERHGGHCGFATDTTGEDDGYWAEARAIDFLAPLMPR